MSRVDMAEAVEAAFGLAVVVCVTIGLSLIWAFVIRDLWQWFAVPLGAPVLSLAHVWGLMILKGMIFYRVPTEEERKQWLTRLLMPLVSWLLGALAAWWMA